MLILHTELISDKVKLTSTLSSFRNGAGLSCWVVGDRIQVAISKADHISAQWSILALANNLSNEPVVLKSLIINTPPSFSVEGGLDLFSLLSSDTQTYPNRIITASSVFASRPPWDSKIRNSGGHMFKFLI